MITRNLKEAIQFILRGRELTAREIAVRVDASTKDVNKVLYSEYGKIFHKVEGESNAPRWSLEHTASPRAQSEPSTGDIEKLDLVKIVDQRLTGMPIQDIARANRTTSESIRNVLRSDQRTVIFVRPLRQDSLDRDMARRRDDEMQRRYAGGADYKQLRQDFDLPDALITTILRRDRNNERTGPFDRQASPNRPERLRASPAAQRSEPEQKNELEPRTIAANSHDSENPLSPFLAEYLGDHSDLFLKLREKSVTRGSKQTTSASTGVIEDLALSRRPQNALKRSGIFTIDELLAAEPEELLQLPNFGVKSLIEIAQRLSDVGLWFGATFYPEPTGETLDTGTTEWLAVASCVPETILLSATQRERLSQLRSAAILRHEVEPSAPIPMNLEELGFQIRTLNCLRRSSIHTTADLLTSNPKTLLNIPNFGIVSFFDIAARLSAHGLWFVNTTNGLHFTTASTISVQNEIPLVLHEEEEPNQIIDFVLHKIKMTEYKSIQTLSHDLSIDRTRLERLLCDHFKTRNIYLVNKMRSEYRRAARYREKFHRADRIQEMIQMRSAGATLEQIGDKFGITRERVRQLLITKLGKDEAKRLEANGREGKVHQDYHRLFEFIENDSVEFPLNHDLSVMLDQLVSDRRMTAEGYRRPWAALVEEWLCENPGIYPEEFEALTGISPRAGSSLAPNAFARFCLRENSWTVGYSDEQLLNSLRVAATFEFPLSAKKFDDLASVGEIDAPTSQTVMNRFGSWNVACRKAGIEGHQPWTDEYERQWSENDIWSIVQDFLLLDDHRASITDFDLWLQNQEGLPSAARVRQILGKWTDIKRTIYRSESFRSKFRDLRSDSRW